MTDIREGLIQGVNRILLDDLVRQRPNTNYFTQPISAEYRKWLEDEVDKHILTYLRENGAVRKVEGELPVFYNGVNRGRNYQALITTGMREAFKEAGYTLTEPLIEGKI